MSAGAKAKAGARAKVFAALGEGAAARISAALGALAIFAVFLLVPAFFLMLAKSAALPNWGGELPPVAEEMFLEIGIAAAVFLIARRSRKKGSPLSKAGGFAPRAVGWRAAAALFAAGVGCSAALSALLGLLPIPADLLESYDLVSASAFTGDGRIVATLFAVISMPFFEELLFRGFMLRALLRGFSPRVAVLAVSAVFALMHGHPLWMGYAFLFGLLLGWLALLFGNSAAPMLLHMGVNAAVLPGIFLRGSEEYARLAQNPLFLLFVLAAGGCCAALLLARRDGPVRRIAAGAREGAGAPEDAGRTEDAKRTEDAGWTEDAGKRGAANGQGGPGGAENAERAEAAGGAEGSADGGADGGAGAGSANESGERRE
ncbi:MAG: CPBP family intramembrane metalloprotease [Clostridiales bacterium]|nr:CPBP family intramembrane metalloprotease [Clostridiales bacterium]